MKALKQRFYQEIIKKHKANYFATVRKEILEFQQFQALYHKILQDNDDLNTLIQNLGYIVFYKYINHILDEKLYTKLYQNQKYFLSNLNFIGNLLSYKILPVQQIKMIISGISQIVQNHCNKITSQHIREIFENVQKILSQQQQFNQILICIQQQSLIVKLYDLVINKQRTDYFYKIISFCKKIANSNIAHINDQQLVNCLQMTILTSNRTDQLYTSYSYLAQIFDKIYSPEQQIFQYGSILDKTMKDIYNQKLIDPISFFLIKSFQNKSLIKLIIQMDFLNVILDIVGNILLRKQNYVSIFGHQSIWKILNKILLYKGKNINYWQNYQKSWNLIKNKLEDGKIIRYPYIKQQVGEFLNIVSQTNVKQYFMNLQSLYN